VAVATAGHMQVCTSLQTDNHASTSPHSFLQTGCPSCHPTTSVKALKAFECYSNNIITRISTQTAGLTFSGTSQCSYRVRDVDGSGEKHSTVESYMVVYAANSHTYYYSLFHSRLKTFLFCKSFPPQPFLFFSRTDYMDFPRLLLLLLSITVCYFLVFLFYTFQLLVPCSRLS